MDFFVLFRTTSWLLTLAQLVVSLSTRQTEVDIPDRTSLYLTPTEKWCTNTIFKDRRGIITSPNYPNGYPNHISCTWHILAEIGEVVTIIFLDLDIEDAGSCGQLPCCAVNWVKIGPSLNGTEKEYCGHDVEKPPVYVSSFSKAWIKFHISSIRSGGRGFKLLYTVGSRRGRTCAMEEFECRQKQCIPQALRCNGLPDCDDGSDEEFCFDLCASGKSCRDTFSCYDKHRHCDGNMDCLDFSDELGCGLCSSNETHCGGQKDQCYDPVTQRCNNIVDCTNGVDEKDCIHTCPGKLVCTSGSGCYTSEDRCDGVAQCSDSSDERDCLPDLCNYDRGGFLCDNGRCIREIWKCDHTDDCGDGTDESNCLRNSVLTAAVMGSLICALLLVIAISCTCRLYSLRALENRMSNRETTLHRLSQEYLFREPPPSYAVAVGEHGHNLCVENIHYNSCPRRSRRRPRRARRLHESRRPSIATVDPGRNQNVSCQPFNFFFPHAPGMPNLVGSLPNLVLSQNLSSNNVENQANLDAGNCQDRGMSEEIKSTDVSKDPSNIGSISTDAESSFSEQNDAAKSDDGEVIIPASDGFVVADIQINDSPVDNLSFQSETSSELEDYTTSSLPNESSHCDIDMQPLIR